MRRDIRLRLPRVIVPSPVRQSVDPAKRALGAAELAERGGVAAEQLEQQHGVRRRPFAKFPRLVPSDRPGNDQPDQRHPALELQLRARSRSVKPDLEARAVGQDRVDPALFELVVDEADEGRDAGREQSPDQAAASRESTIPMHQMSATRGHAGSVMNSGCGCRGLGATAASKRNERLTRQPRVAAFSVARITDRNVGVAASAGDFCLRKDRPFEELAQALVAADGLLHDRVAHVRRLALADFAQAAFEGAIFGASITIILPPD